MPISPELGRPPVDLDESKLAKLENKTNNSEVPENTIEEDTEYISKYVEKRIEDFDAIQAKIDQGEDLNPEELKMIYLPQDLRPLGLVTEDTYYDVVRPMVHAGFQIKKGLERDVKTDLSTALGIEQGKISTDQETAMSGNIEFHHGDLKIDIKDLESATFPKVVNGDVEISGITSAEGLKLPEEVLGLLDMSSLTTAVGLILPSRLDGLYLSGLTSPEGLKLNNDISGLIDLSGLKSAKGLELPTKSYGARIMLTGLESYEGLVIPPGMEDYVILKEEEPKPMKPITVNAY